MTNEQEDIVFDYLAKFPDSITRRQVDFDNEDLMQRIVPLMKKALADNEPLTDDIFNAPDGALL